MGAWGQREARTRHWSPASFVPILLSLKCLRIEDIKEQSKAFSVTQACAGISANMAQCAVCICRGHRSAHTHTQAVCGLAFNAFPSTENRGPWEMTLDTGRQSSGRSAYSLQGVAARAT